MLRVLHISADYPDALQPAKTRAIANLVEATADQLDHRVYSLNRANGWKGWLRPGSPEIIERRAALVAMRYHAPRWGLMLARSMEAVAVAIAADLDAQGFEPDVIHGHKLSFEGLAAQALARQLGKPFVLSLQGNTDQKVVSARRDLHQRYSAVWHEAAHVFAFSPWIAAWCEDRFGARHGPTSNLPCIVASEQILPPSNNADTVGTAFNFEFWQNKNIETLVKAVALARREVPTLKFKIAGTGSDAAKAKVSQLVEAAGITEITTMSGQISSERIQGWMNDAAVFALPSRRETFGMVFVEALLAGTPIIYPAGAAVDGYFDSLPFASPVSARKPGSIAAALVRALKNQHETKAGLAVWQRDEAARSFQREAIVAGYCAAIERVTA